MLFNQYTITPLAHPCRSHFPPHVPEHLLFKREAAPAPKSPRLSKKEISNAFAAAHVRPLLHLLCHATCALAFKILGAEYASLHANQTLQKNLRFTIPAPTNLANDHDQPRPLVGPAQLWVSVDLPLPGVFQCDPIHVSARLSGLPSPWWAATNFASMANCTPPKRV